MTLGVPALSHGGTNKGKEAHVNFHLPALIPLIEQYGWWCYPITFFITMLEGETPVVIQGYLAHKGLISLPLLILSAWSGSFIGDQIYFFLGRRYGTRILKRFPRWAGPVENALGLLRRRSTIFILTYRFIYCVRNFSSFALGMSQVPWSRFVVLNFIAAGLWAVSFAGAGYVFGEAAASILGDAAMVGLGALVVALIGVWWFMSGPKRRARAAARAPAGVERSPL